MKSLEEKREYNRQAQKKYYKEHWKEVNKKRMQKYYNKDIIDNIRKNNYIIIDGEIYYHIISTTAYRLKEKYKVINHNNKFYVSL